MNDSLQKIIDDMGEYQVLQILYEKSPSVWCCVYDRNHMPEHYTVDRRLDRLVRIFVSTLSDER